MKKKRVVIYIRVSTQEQATEGYSIGEQTERLQKYAEAMGWEIIKIYTDAGHSGASTDRPGLQAMIKDIKKGKIDSVVVYKLDRLSRSQKDTLYLIEDVFLANNTDFVSMSENFDTSTPFGRAIIGILAVFAQLEREQIKERMKMGAEARAKLGKFHGSNHVPIGYEYIDGELVTNEFEKIQIQKVFEMYAEGASPYAIADRLNASGYSHKYGKWQEKTIRTFIVKKTYLGYLPYNGEWYKGSHEPFITEEIFEKCQKVREKRSEEHKKYNRRSGKANSYLGGYLECGCCTAKYSKLITRWKKKDGTYSKYYYYMCNSKSKRKENLVRDPNCKNKNWKMQDLDNLVFNEIKTLAIDPEYINTVKDSAPADNRAEVIKEEIKNLDSQISRLMDLYVVGKLPIEVLNDKIESLNDKKESLQNEIESIEKENEKRLSAEETQKAIESFSEVLSMGDFEKIRGVIGTLIKKVSIDNEDITIHWNF